MGFHLLGPKRAILGAQESAKIASESYLGLSYRCFGAVDSPKTSVRQPKIALRGYLGALLGSQDGPKDEIPYKTTKKVIPMIF